MKFRNKLWKRGKMSFSKMVSQIVLLNLYKSKKYNVIWEFNEKIGKWTVGFEEIEPAVA